MVIIHSTDIKKLLRTGNKGESCLFVVAGVSAGKDYASTEQPSPGEIRLEEIDDDERSFSEKEYVKNIAELGAEYNSVEWWANDVSEKNEYTPHHYKNLLLYFRLIKTLRKYIDSDAEILVACNREIFQQLYFYCRRNNIPVKSVDSRFILMIKKACGRLVVFLRIIKLLLRTLYRKIYADCLWGGKFSGIPEGGGAYYVIRTWLDGRFLINDQPAAYAYFGNLPEYVADSGHSVLVLAGIVDNFRKIVNKVKDAGDFPVVPEEFFLRYTDFLTLLTCLHFRNIKLMKDVFFNTLNVTVLYENAISNGYRSPYYLRNILAYLIAKGFARAVRFNAYIHTFENYAWEKTMVLGLKEGACSGEVLGFQHAYVSRSSFKYFPGMAERDILPIPDRIVTMGRVTKDIMERYGSYPAGILRTGCALRQEYMGSLTPFKRRRFNKILVPLNMIKDESASIMTFLFEAGLPEMDIRVIIRCHPGAPFDTFKDRLHFAVPQNFVISHNKSVAQDLEDTDMVIYTWTTVAVEAIKSGLPAIYLDILSPMYVDPLFECTALKKAIKKPGELLPAINGFYEMQDEAFYREQLLAQDYLKDYFYPVNKHNMASFLPDMVLQ